MQKEKLKLLLLIPIIVSVFNACNELTVIDNKIEMLPRLSAYNIFKGNPSNLIPTRDYKLYELSTALFSDYAEKQRLIKVPAGSTLVASNDGLPEFPDGTTLVKSKSLPRC